MAVRIFSSKGRRAASRHKKNIVRCESENLKGKNVLAAFHFPFRSEQIPADEITVCSFPGSSLFPHCIAGGRLWHSLFFKR